MGNLFVIVLFVLALSERVSPLEILKDNSHNTSPVGENSKRGGGKKSGRKSSSSETVTVTTDLGRLRGRTYPVHIKNEYFYEGLVAGFLSVPYAEVPERFSPPVKKKAWGGILDTTDFGPICWQPGEQKIWDAVRTRNETVMKKRKLEHYDMSEDCLSLSIYVPLRENSSLPFDTKLPVLLYIHGGSYYMNAGRLYPGHILAAVQNLIIVTINYRLSVFAVLLSAYLIPNKEQQRFLSTEDSVAPGNYGMLDQVMALDFVYNNIRTFGGDPNKITLVGNSAGGASTMSHLFSPLSRGKFVALTAQSGCSGAPWAIQLSPRKHALHLSLKLGCPTDSNQKMIECLKTFSPDTIMKNAKLEDGLSLAYAIVIDGAYGGTFLYDKPSEMILRNDFVHVPILSGFTRDEVTIWFDKFGPKREVKELNSFISLDVISLLENIPTVTNWNIEAMIHAVTVQYLYRAGTQENDTYGKTSSVSDFISDVGLKAPCIKEINLLAEKNSQPVYLYEFTYYSLDDQKMNKQSWIGSYHESELQFIFGEPYLNYSNHLRTLEDKAMSDLMMKIWADFVRHGNPTPKHSKKINSENSPEKGLDFEWTNYTEKDQDFSILNLNSRMDKYFLTNRMLFWNFFFPIFRDYPFTYNESQHKSSCNNTIGWEALTRSWLFWTLAALTCFLSFILTIIIAFSLQKKFRKPIRIPPAESNSRRNPNIVSNNSNNSINNLQYSNNSLNINKKPSNNQT